MAEPLMRMLLFRDGSCFLVSFKILFLGLFAVAKLEGSYEFLSTVGSVLALPAR